MMRHGFKSMDEMWANALVACLGGQPLPSRVGACRETLGYAWVLEDPTRGWVWNPARKLSAAYGSAELLWYLSGSSDATMLRSYAPSYENYLDDGVHAYGAYGARWKEGEQLRSAVRLLKEQPSTRQCVISCWRPGDLRVAVERKTKDLPCTLTLQLLLRDNALHMVANMRSNDAWLGMPYDAWCFTRLQIMVAACVGADVGTYQHQAGSMHLYDKNAEQARQAVATWSEKSSELCSRAARASRAGFECVDEMEKQVGRATALEQVIRMSPQTPIETKLRMIDSQLPPGTILGETVACCARKLTGRSPTWLREDL